MISQLIKSYTKKRIIGHLKSADPNALLKSSEKNTLKAFQRNAKKIEAYGKILADNKIDTNEISTIDDFRSKVPIITKADVFPKFDMDQLCLNNNIKNIKSIFTSSGFSGTYAYGVNTKKNHKTVSDAIDFTLDYLFETSVKNTFLISCLAMGVKVHTKLPLAETSVRSDMVIAIIKKMVKYYDQFIIVGDPYFIKKLIEDGIANGLDWKAANVSFIFGGDWFSQSFKEYIEQLIELDPENKADNRKIVGTMGATELDLNIFHDSTFSAAIRREAQKNKELKKDLFRIQSNAVPELFHYYPHRTFLESVNEELVFSMLSPAIHSPLMRYNTKDRGEVLKFDFVKSVLEKHGLDHLVPDIKLPFVSVLGRATNFIEYNGEKIFAEELKQSLYEDFEVGSKTTGYFKLGRNTEYPIEVQLKKGIKSELNLIAKFENAFNSYTSMKVPVKVYEYEAFPYGMELNYEKKFITM